MTHYNKKPSDPVRYRPEDPNCYTYVDGYGFAPPPPVITERRMLQFYSNGLGFAILLYFLMAASVPFGVLRLFSLIWPVIRVYGNQVVASSSIIQLVNIFSSTICMLVPFLLFMLLRTFRKAWKPLALNSNAAWWLLVPLFVAAFFFLRNTAWYQQWFY